MGLPLKQGATFSLLEGPETGRLLLMIHGATVPHWEFDRLVPHLHKATGKHFVWISMAMVVLLVLRETTLFHCLRSKSGKHYPT